MHIEFFSLRYYVQHGTFYYDTIRYNHNKGFLVSAFKLHHKCYLGRIYGGIFQTNSSFVISVGTLFRLAVHGWVISLEDLNELNI